MRAKVAEAEAERTIAQRRNDVRRIAAELEAEAKSIEERAEAGALAAHALAMQDLEGVRRELEALRLQSDVVVPADIAREAAALAAAGAAAPTADSDCGWQAMSCARLPGGELAGSRQCYDVLVERGLSAHLMIDWDGTIYQALDLQTACAFHAGHADARSIGVEMCNPELPERNDPKDPRPVGALEVTNAGATGARRAVLGFYPRQVDAAIALARAIANLFHIRLVLPKATSPTSTAGVTRGFDPRVACVSSRLTRPRLAGRLPNEDSTAVSDSDYLLHQVAVELRYEDGFLYYDKSGEAQRMLLRTLGQPFVASHPAARLTEQGTSITSSNLASRAEHLDIQYDGERFWARHFGADNLARVEQVVPPAWDVVGSVLEVKQHVRRYGARYWILWAADSEDAVEVMLHQLGVPSESERWIRIFGGTPKKRTFAGAVQDGCREIRYHLAAGAAKVDGDVPDSLKKFNVPHGLLLDVDHSQTFDAGSTLGKQDLKEFIRESWTKTKAVAERLGKELK
jgi:hypothetical protein